MKREYYFEKDTYETPVDTKRRFWDYLFLGSRWYFVIGYIGEVFRARSLALKNAYNRRAWSDSSYRIFRLIEGCGGKFHLKGLENIRSVNGPVVFVSNHMSTLETFVFPCIIAPFMKVTFVVKESLVNHPLFGPVMRSRYPIVVKRKDARKDFQTVLEKGKELLSKGIAIILFPQSTRMSEFNPKLFNSLGVKLALASGVQVIPVAIKTDFWGNGYWLKDVGAIHRERPIYMTFGKPMQITGNGKAEHKQITEFIIDNLQQWIR
jgi:1-acyl-sn-glycerol-3-phosphate acyltransferase